jgi:hypothetical protein
MNSDRKLANPAIVPAWDGPWTRSAPTSVMGADSFCGKEEIVCFMGQMTTVEVSSSIVYSGWLILNLAKAEAWARVLRLEIVALDLGLKERKAGHRKVPAIPTTSSQRPCRPKTTAD